MSRRLLWLVPIALLGACVPKTQDVITGESAAMIHAHLTPGQATVPDSKGNVQSIAASRDADGVQTDFIEGLIRLRHASSAELADFLERYGGTVVSDDAIPEPPAGSGITLTDEQRQATEYVVRINLAKVDVPSFAANAAAQGLAAGFQVSSDAGLRTFAAVADAVASGFHASPDFMSYGDGNHDPIRFPEVLTETNDPGDAFKRSYFGTSGSQSNVTTAWQFLAAHGFQRRVKVAIIDGGFWLDHDGKPRNPSTDFPAHPEQHNFIDSGNPSAEGPNETKCSTGSNCYWHGTGAALVATGIANNAAAYAGTGGFVADPMLLKTNLSESQNDAAIRYAVAMGADVVSMSFSQDCNAACQRYDRDDVPVNEAVNAGSKTVFVASAGNKNQDVNRPNFVHPCIADHIICVGALDDGATHKIDSSSFGDGVDVFAPTNIWVEAMPSRDESDPDDPNHTAEATRFGGTSAAAPFVAGVAAMMKAINPDLGSDDVARILRGSAHTGSGEVRDYLDAYAAVHAAAQGIPGVRDKLENNDLETTPHNFGLVTNDLRDDLNFDTANDIDYFKFESPAGSTMTLDLVNPVTLVSISLVNFHGLNGAGQPILECDGDVPGLGHKFFYMLPGGTYEFGLRANDVTAYDMVIKLDPPSTLTPPDIYEPNDSVATAKYIYSFKTSGVHSKTQANVVTYASLASVTIDASIHVATDVDYYIVRAAQMTFVQQVLLSGYPVVEVYGNESHMTLDVWNLNGDKTQGALLESVSGGSCGSEIGTPQLLSVRLDPDQFYLVRVTGGIGQYTLRNGLHTKKRDIAVLEQDPLYVILNPGDPIEHVLRFAEKYVFVADAGYSSVRVVGPGVHLRLLDSANNAIAEGVLNGLGEILNLSSTVVNQVYAVEASLKNSGGPAVVKLEWDAAQPTLMSANLIVNPGAEIIVGPDPDQDVPYWDIQSSTPRIFFYDDAIPTANPSFVGPGPEDRGMHLFAGGPSNASSSIRQRLSVDPAWQQAINEGHVKFTFSAFLGGLLSEPDHTDATLTFRDGNFQTLRQQQLPSITSLEREGKSGLLPVEASDDLPAGTLFIDVDLTFVGGTGDYNDGYADNLSLTLSQY